eukprot:4373725-Amphidinium_carterae.2
MHQVKKCREAQSGSHCLTDSMWKYSGVQLAPLQIHVTDSKNIRKFTGLPQLMTRWHTRQRPVSVLQKDDVTPTPGDNIQPQGSEPSQLTTATTTATSSSMDSKKLQKAMIKEMGNLKELKLFTDVDVKSVKAEEKSRNMYSRWDISERPGSDGTTDFKARSVARRFSHFIEDPDLIYAATPHMSSLKLLPTVAAQKQWIITTTGTQAAFLNSKKINALVDVTEVIHVKPPRGFYSNPEDQPKVLRLNKALNGLKNSPKLWQKHLVKVLVDQFKMSQLKSDACVFYNQSESMFFLSYVDDLLIIGEESEVNGFITNISSVFNLKHTTHQQWDLDSLSWQKESVRVSDRDLNDGDLHAVSV